MQAGDLVRITSNPNNDVIFEIVEVCSNRLYGLKTYPKGRRTVYAHQSELAIV